MKSGRFTGTGAENKAGPDCMHVFGGMETERLRCRIENAGKDRQDRGEAYGRNIVFVRDAHR